MRAHIGALAKEVLEEVPEQITSFMTMKKLHPLQKQAHLVKQATMANIYEGPSTLVRANTKMNVGVGGGQQAQQSGMYPNVQQGGLNPSAQPVNPYYSAQQPQVVYVQGAMPNNGNQFIQNKDIIVNNKQYNKQHIPTLWCSWKCTFCSYILVSIVSSSNFNILFLVFLNFDMVFFCA